MCGRAAVWFLRGSFCFGLVTLAGFMGNFKVCGIINTVISEKIDLGIPRLQLRRSVFIINSTFHLP